MKNSNKNLKNTYKCADCGEDTETFTLVGKYLKKEIGLCYKCWEERKGTNKGGGILTS